MTSPFECELMIEVPGGQVFVKRWSPKNAPRGVPLVLLHDSLGCVELWRDFPRRLCERLGRDIVAYDRLGFGKSSEQKVLPSQRFIEEEAEIVLPALLDSLGATQFDVLGHSVGGAMAVACGAKVQTCRAIVTEAAQAFVEAKTIAGIEKAKAAFIDPKNFARLEKYHGAKAPWVLRAWTEVWLAPEFASWSLAPLLPKVRCPILAVHGDGDDYGSTAFPEMIAALAGGRAKTAVIAACGHVPHREKPEQILDLLQAFFDGIKEGEKKQDASS